MNSLAYPVSLSGKKLNKFLDSLDVTNKWLPHRYVNWKTGESFGNFDRERGTHCSEFVAAAVTKLGISILQPPQHPELLANAQYYWLQKQGGQHGWATVENDVSAQKIANQGCLVVVAYANPNKHRPGHVAIVRPSSKSKAEIRSGGPQIVQAGGKNFNSTALANGFRYHRGAFKNHKMAYYAHGTSFCRLLVKKDEARFSKIKTL